MNNPFAVLEARLSNIETLLLDIKHAPKNQGEQPDPDELLTIQEAAEFLSLSVPTIYCKVSKNELPVCKAPGSKRLYFSRTDLMEYVKAGRKKTLAETAAEAEAYIKKKGGNNG